MTPIANDADDDDDADGDDAIDDIVRTTMRERFVVEEEVHEA